MNITIITKVIYGILNPHLKLKFKCDIKLDRIKIVVNGNNYDYNSKDIIYEDEIIDIDLSLPKNIRKIMVYACINNKEILIYSKNYGYLYRFFKIISKPFRVIINRLKRIFNPFIRAIKLMWTRHHFLVPPKYLKKYIKSFFKRCECPYDYQFYNPEIPNDYQNWLKEDKSYFEYIDYEYNPKISVIIPVYNAKAEYLTECIESVLKQSYKNFEICLADDCSTNKETLDVLKKYENNEKIKIIYRQENGMISKCMNSAVSIATGDFIGFLDNDDVLDKNALYYNVIALNKNKNLDMIYSDEDKLDENGNYCDVNFKPDWSYDTMLSMNYICHFTVVRKSLFDQVGGFDSQYDGAQDYDLFLKITEKTKNIKHIHRVLYHWRKSETSTAASENNKDYARIAGKKAIEAALKRRKIDAEVILDNRSPFYIVKYNLKKEPKVSIVIPTKDHKEILEKCLTSIYEKTTYKNYEVVVIDNNTTEENAVKYLKSLPKKYNNLKVLTDNGEFNYSRINNDAIKKLTTDYVLLLNNDTEVITPEWIDLMVGYASQSHVGTVGVKLLYPDNTIQHAGVILGLGGVAGHAFIGKKREDLGYFGRLCVPYNYSANTAACLMVSKKKYDEVNGLEEDLKVAFNDIDFNLKLLEKGYFNVFLPNVELYHYESKTRGLDTKGEKKIRFDKERDYMIDKWKDRLDCDYFYNDNFTRNMWFLLDRR